MTNVTWLVHCGSMEMICLGKRALPLHTYHCRRRCTNKQRSAKMYSLCYNTALLKCYSSPCMHLVSVGEEGRRASYTHTELVKGFYIFHIKCLTANMSRFVSLMGEQINEFIDWSCSPDLWIREWSAVFTLTRRIFRGKDTRREQILSVKETKRETRHKWDSKKHKKGRNIHPQLLINLDPLHSQKYQTKRET